uniref:Histone-lysine N-methyltransferase n=2 Tax=Ascaris TaxID=6251 RepID=A0A9J2P810_ASCLU
MTGDEVRQKKEGTREAHCLGFYKSSKILLSYLRLSGLEEECFVCALNDDDDISMAGEQKNIKEELWKCSACKTKFHRTCFLSFCEGDFVPRMHILDAAGDPCIDMSKAKKWLCPQHECNFCNQELLRTRSQIGQFISCASCVFAWHKSCVIIGSHHIDRHKDRYVLCPRHAEVNKSCARNTPYCVRCDRSSGKKLILRCSLCIRSYCECYFEGFTETDKVEKCLESSRGEFVCDSCQYHDYPRIGDYVLAASRGCLWPAKTLHADLLPTTLLNNAKLVERLREPGYVLVQWIEGLAVPNYDAISFRDMVAFPTTLKCPVWAKFRAHKNIQNAVRAIYESNEIVTGVDRPLPDEVKHMKAPHYRRIQVNINGRLAKSTADGLGQCNCGVVSGNRCSPTHGCLNRSTHVECPKNCDELFAGAQRQISSRNSRTRETAKVRLFSAEKQQTGVCVNNFLRNHKRTDDDEWMEERRTTNKGFGVFAKKYIPAGQELTEYVGRVMPRDEYFEQLNFIGTFNNLEMSYFGMQITNEFYVDARNCGNMSRSVNHSCEPNCKVNAVTVDGVYRLKVSALKDIAAGDELTYDYGTELWSGMVGMRCRCGTAGCRGVIGKLVNGANRKEYHMNGKVKQQKRVSTLAAQEVHRRRAVKRMTHTSNIQLPKVHREAQALPPKNDTENEFVGKKPQGSTANARQPLSPSSIDQRRGSRLVKLRPKNKKKPQNVKKSTAARRVVHKTNSAEEGYQNAARRHRGHLVMR